MSPRPKNQATRIENLAKKNPRELIVVSDVQFEVPKSLQKYIQAQNLLIFADASQGKSLHLGFANNLYQQWPTIKQAFKTALQTKGLLSLAALTITAGIAALSLRKSESDSAPLM